MSYRMCRWFVTLSVLLISAAWFPVLQAREATQQGIPAYTNEEYLTKMLLVDIAERLLDGQPALAITFSQDLKPNTDFNAFITLTRDGKAVPGQWRLAKEPRRLYFSNIQPATQYQVQIRPGIVSKTHVPLMQPVSRSVTTRAIQPAFDFSSRGRILPATLHGGLPISVVNVPEVDLEFLQVRPEKLAEVLKRIRLSERLHQWHLEDIYPLAQSVFSQRYVTNAKPNVQTSLVIPLRNIEALAAPGVYFAVMRQPGRFHEAAYRISPFVVTNIGLHVRLYPRGLEVFVHALDSGKPLADVTLQLQGEQEARQQRSNADGRASFLHRPQGDLLLTAMQGEQFAFLDLRDAPLDLSEYPVQGLADRALAPFLYSNRDWMRPGETLDFSVLLRDRDGYPLSIDRLQLRIVRPDGKVWSEEVLTASHSKLGLFEYALTLPETALNGEWRAEVRLNPQDTQSAAQLAFRVESLSPERMKLTLTSENKRLANAEQWLIAVQGDYWHGVPARGNAFSAVRTAQLNRHPLPGLETYYFGDPADAQWLTPMELPALILNDSGGGFLEVPAFASKINSPLALKLEGRLQELGGRSVYQRLETSFWPEHSLVGIDPLFDDDGVASNTQAHFSLVRVNAAGEPSVGTRPLAVTLVREQRDDLAEYHATQGWQRRTLVTHYPITQQKIRLDAQARAHVAFTVQSGYYRLEVEDAETGLKAVYPFHAGWEEAKTATQRPDQITLTLDKASYRAGEQAQLHITPPLAGEAIVAVEGESMLWSQRISLPATGTSISIPLEKAWNRHDLYVTVSAFHPLNKAQPLQPSRSFGVVFLPLERAERQLNVTLEADDKWLPQQTARVTIKVDNLAKQSALVTLAAVDVDALRASGFKTPDPFAFYFAQHAYGVKVYDAYGQLIKDGASPLAEPTMRESQSAIVTPAMKAPSPAQSTAIINKSVVFDSEGVARIDVPLPAFEGRLRLMAVVATPDRFGSAQREVQVTAPVTLQVNAPAFLASGDRALVTVGLRNTTDVAQAVQLNMIADSGLDIPATRYEVVLEPNQPQQWRVPVSPRHAQGKGTLNVTLTGTTFRIQHQVPIVLRSAAVEKHFSQQRELKPGESWILDASALQGFAPESIQAHLSIAPTPVLPLRSAVQRLLQLPAVGLEQHLSRARLILLLNEKASQRLGLEALPAPERDAQINAAVLQLAMEQRDSGGFTLWNQRTAALEDSWLTSYAVDFLLDAQAAGVQLPSGLLERAVQQLAAQLRVTTPSVEARYAFSEVPAHLDFANRAYAMYVLSRYDKQRVNLSQLQGMYDKETGSAQAGLPLVHLGLALNTLGDTKRAAQAIAKGLAVVRDDKLYMGDYGSSLRDEAAMLYLLLRNKVPIAQQASRIAQFADALQQRAVLSSQELFFTSLLGLQLQAANDEAWQAQLVVDKQLISLNKKGMLSQALSTQALHSGVELTVTGKQPVLVNLAVDGYARALPALDNDPIEVAREWYTLQGQRITPEAFKVGDLLLVQLRVRSNVAVNDALVVDMLPAGFELENTALGDYDSLASLPLEGSERTVAELGRGTKPHSEMLEKDRYSAALSLQAKVQYRLFYRVRVVAIGDVVIPPPRAVSLYTPTINGVGLVGGKLTVPP